MLVRPALGGSDLKLFFSPLSQFFTNAAVGIASAIRAGRSLNITTEGLMFCRVSVLPSNLIVGAVWMNNQLASVPAALAVSTGSAKAGPAKRAVLSNAAAAYFTNVMIFLPWLRMGGLFCLFKHS